MSGLNAIGSAMARPELDEQQRAQLNKAATEFESLFVHMMLKSMRSTVGEAEIFGESNELRTFQELLDEELAKVVARDGSLGLAGVLERELLRRPEALNDLQAATAQASSSVRKAEALDAYRASGGVTPTVEEW